ncbi:hypothetical protein FA09DRAFT_16346 [Tilletiopsis washingtonensis]|uniref:Uncharacterized protein n=1 Tax=Tilletiopsis washingtonensis TaxID=58919 RepID=A0A316Z9V7_9BASI|nr:hypothetical protein FA09DRAFT_16346 [Tilletiopsis washingtonensis]PWN98076.1 hypothetical protein FA09DRAFT_16346 [Tilletiopsis washingtonensis]
MRRLCTADLARQALYGRNVAVVALDGAPAGALDVLLVACVRLLDLGVQRLERFVVRALLLGDALEVLGAVLIERLVLALDQLGVLDRRLGHGVEEERRGEQRLHWHKRQSAQRGSVNLRDSPGTSANALPTASSLHALPSLRSHLARRAARSRYSSNATSSCSRLLSERCSSLRSSAAASRCGAAAAVPRPLPGPAAYGVPAGNGELPPGYNEAAGA